eukprot:350008-Chlamydomonas_euryale.AAC.2
MACRVVMSARQPPHSRRAADCCAHQGLRRCVAIPCAGAQRRQPEGYGGMSGGHVRKGSAVYPSTSA